MKAGTLALAFAAIMALPAGAQTLSPFPLDVGNRWEYQNGTDVMTWEIVSDTTVAGERIARLRVNNGAVCGVRETASPDGTPYFPLVDPSVPTAPCTAAFDYPGGGPYAQGVPQQQSVTIGDTTVTGPTWSGLVSDGAGIITTDTWTMLGGVGLTRFDRQVRALGGFPPTVVFVYTLAHARIRGVSYGQPLPPASSSPFPAYVPLGMGDRWDYALFSGPPGSTTPDGVASLTVTSVATDEERRRVVRLAVVRRTVSGGETRAECTLNRMTGPTTLTGALFCELANTVFPDYFYLQGETGPASVEIGGQTVTADRAAGGQTTRVSYPNTSSTATRGVEAARGIGIVGWSYSLVYEFFVPPTYRSGRLVYARVGGVSYGQQAVAGEDAPSVSRALTLRPNPARTQATLRFAAAGHVAEAVVRDALGRVVLRVAVPAGATEATLDVSGLAAGVYVVGSGTASVRLVVAH
ncbi:MAG TPA: T9SS type A sorting domain-containing protein [Rubricoccaceae bacterium]|jgi:hypothetical protein